MVTCVPVHDSGCSPEPEVSRDGRSTEPCDCEAPDREMRDPQGANSRKRKDRDQEPGEEADQEPPSAQDHEKSRGKPCAIGTYKKLRLREVGFPASFSKERSRGIKKTILIDLYMFKISVALERFEPFMRKRSSISKIIPVQDILVLLSEKGVCCTFSRVTNDMIAFVTRTGEMTDDIFFNKNNNSLIVLSSGRNDDYTEKRYRSIPIGLLRTQDNTGYPIFESVQGRLLIEFHALNGKALLNDGKSHKVFDLNTYSMMYEIPGIDVARVICRPNVLLVVKKNRKNLLPLVIKSIEFGNDIGHISYPTEGRLEHLEIFQENILIKERSKWLQVIDLQN